MASSAENRMSVYKVAGAIPLEQNRIPDCSCSICDDAETDKGTEPIASVIIRLIHSL